MISVTEISLVAAVRMTVITVILCLPTVLLLKNINFSRYNLKHMVYLLDFQPTDWQTDLSPLVRRTS